MPNAVEIEVKVLLSEANYRKLLSHFSSFPKHTQINHYIDLVDLSLSKRKIAIRIRESGDSFELTMKTNLAEGRLERNLDISKKQFLDFVEEGFFPEGEVKELLTKEGIDTKALRIFTSLKTERAEDKYQGGILSIDKNTYSNIVDYELEYESDSMENATKIITELLDNLAIPPSFSEKPKIRRAIEAYESNR